MFILSFSCHAAKAAILSMLVASALTFGQTPRTPSGNTDFNVAPLKDEAAPTGHKGEVRRGERSQVDSPERTVGPQRDGSIVVSDNQTLTPAGKLIELGSPVRAKAIALNPDKQPTAQRYC